MCRRHGTITVINCYNLGKCTNGIVYRYQAGAWDAEIILNIKNCYNLGEVVESGILGRQGTVSKKTELNIENCYNAGTSDKAIIGAISFNTRTETITNVTNTYYDQTKSTSVGAITEGIEALNEEDIKNNESFVETLNNNIGENTEWKRWKLGEDGYPTFE